MTGMGSKGGIDGPYLCFLLLGCGTLFPWNALITAADFWEARYPGRHTDRLLTVAYLPINLAVIAAMVAWHARIRPRLRIVGGLLGFTLAISAVPLLDLAGPSNGTLAVLLLLVAACGACDGFAQGALFGEAALLPPRFTQALVAGTAVSGVVVSLLRVVTKATLPDTEEGLRHSANLYFIIAALVCAACTVVYSYVLPRLPAVQHYRHAALEAALHGSEVDECDSSQRDEEGAGCSRSPSPWQQQQQQWRGPSPVVPAGRSSVDLELSTEDHMHHSASDPDLPGDRQQPQLHGPQWEHHQHRQQQQQQQDQQPAYESAGQALLSSPDGRTLLLSDGWQQQQQAARWHQRQQHEEGGVNAASVQPESAGSGKPLTARAVFHMLWQLAVANMLIYTITLSIFPGVLAEDVHSAELGSWYPVGLLTAFNIADWAGKSLPGLPMVRLRDERAILGATLLRILFVPAFHFAAVGGAGPAVIGLLTFTLGMSNGYLTGCAMMEAPALVPAAAAELAGNLMVLALIAGLCIGAACGFLWLL